MIALAIITLVLLLAVVAVLFTPVRLYVDTDQGRYELFQKPVIHFAFVPTATGLCPKFKLFGLNVPLAGSKDSTRARPKKAKSRKPFHRSWAAWRDLVKQIVGSIRINSAVLDVDTDDVVVNAQLVPAFYSLSHGPVRLSCNFHGRVYAHLDASGMPAQLLWSALRFLIKK